jgi:membrane fusion protein (multidrug efflux system)
MTAPLHQTALSAPAPAPRARGLASIFRGEAIEHRGEDVLEGDVLRLTPRWVSTVYVVLLIASAFALAVSVLMRVDEFATGPAVVRLDGRSELTTHVAGTIARILVAPGQSVSKGDPLVVFHSEEEQATFDRTKREYESLLIKVLRDQSDQTTKHALAGLAAQLRQAEARLADRTILANQAGTVSDLRIREGQSLAAGDRLLTIASPESRGRIVALVPANYRPMVKPGMRMRVELRGFAYEYQNLTVESVGNEAVGPAEVRRYLGPDLADTVSVDGPVVLVQASTGAATFTSGGRVYSFIDGMAGAANVRVRSLPIAVALVPGLRWLLGGEP